MSVCISCGGEVADNAKFCANCGAPLSAPAAKEAPAVEEIKAVEAAEEAREAAEETVEAVEAVESIEAAEAVEAAVPVEAAAPVEAAEPVEAAAPVGVIELAEAAEPAAPVAAFVEEPAETVAEPPVDVYEAPRAPVEPEYIPKTVAETPVATIPMAQPVTVSYAEPREEYRQPEPEPAPEPVEDPEKPGKKSKWGIMSTWGYVGATLLMAIPCIGLILTIIWACGGCRKYAKRNYARAALIFLFAGVILTVAAALVLRFAFPELIVWAFEILNPGYTIVF